MGWAIYAAAAIAVLVVVYLAARYVTGYLKLRGTRVVVCPETHETAAVEIDAKRAARLAALGSPRFKLTECSRWPERQECGRECLAQIEAAPEGCLVRTKVAAWYAGKACVLCGRAIGDLSVVDHAPALLTPAQATVGLQEIEAEHLAEILQTHQPVCWSCHITEKFRREHPELVIDNTWQPKAAPR